jgi:hypothetical protein
MFQYLLWIPAGTSLVLGVIYVFLGDARPPVKAVGFLWFAAAVYLQFGSRWSLAGLLAQTALAVMLAFWRKADDSA